MQFTRITIFHVLWLVGVPACTIVAASYSLKRYGWIVAIIFGTLGLVVGHLLWCLLIEGLRRLNMMSIAARSTDRLWNDVRKSDWNMNQTLMLLQLAARDEDVNSELPRILAMLGSESMLERRYGWDTLRIVFTPNSQLIERYDPCESTEVCRRKAAPLTHQPDDTD